MEADRKKAEDMHQKALETMGKTQPEQRRAEKMVLGALEYLKERTQQDQALKQEELKLKKQENDSCKTSRHSRFRCLK